MLCPALDRAYPAVRRTRDYGVLSVAPGQGSFNAIQVCRRASPGRWWWLPVLTAALNWPAHAQIEVFQGIGDLPGGVFRSQPTDISAGDPLVVVGFSDSANGVEAFRWTPGGGMIGLGDIPGGDFWSMATRVSADGQTVVGYSRWQNLTPTTYGDQGFVWRPGVGIIELKPLRIASGQPGWDARALGVSANGNIVVGESFKGDTGQMHPCVWETPFNRRPDLLETIDPNLEYGSAFDVSDNGTVIVGVAWGTGCRWTVGVPENIGNRWLDVSGDGTVMAGWGTTYESGIWSRAGGFQSLAMIPLGVSGDGSVVVGKSEVGRTPLIWDATNGIRDLHSVLENDYGADLTGWTLWEAVAVSEDGKMIVGQGHNPSSNQEAWVVFLDGDEDEDGLRDSWETDGIDVDHDNIIDLDLPAMGADPMHKDLFVELDLMEGLAYPALSKFMVETAFASAPLMNPDTTEGIKIHIIVDESDLPRVDDWPTDASTSWPVDFDNYKTNSFGTTTERAHVAAPQLLAMKARCFRYGIGTYALDKKIGGIAELPGNDFVISIGSATFNNGTNDDEEKASLLMHELGHNLNLRHGGIDDINGKPNYVSVMNYALSYPANWSVDFWELDYSRLEMLPLDETYLDEYAGINALGLHTDYVMPFGVTAPVVGGGEQREIRYVHLDGRGTDFGNPSGDLYQDGQWDYSVAQDLNYLGPASTIGATKNPSPDQELLSHDDWSNIVLAMPYPPTGDYGDGSHATPPTDELTEDDITWINENFPDPPGACHADVDVDGTVGIEDFLAVLANWGPCDAACAADTDDSGSVGIEDFLAVLANWGPCPE